MEATNRVSAGWDGLSRNVVSTVAVPDMTMWLIQGQRRPALVDLVARVVGDGSGGPTGRGDHDHQTCIRVHGVGGGSYLRLVRSDPIPARPYATGRNDGALRCGEVRSIRDLRLLLAPLNRDMSDRSGY